MRVGSWIPLRNDRQGANIGVLRWQDRPDLAAWANDQVVYELQDVFTVSDGNWDRVGQRWGPDQWARDAYLGKIAAGGASPFWLVSCLDQSGKAQPGKGFVFSTGDPGKVTERLLTQAGWTRKNLPADGWLAVEMFSSSTYFPDQGQQGPWAIMPFGLSDVLVGVGMPYQHHISTFGVWQEKPRTVVTPPPPPDGGTVDLTETNGLLRELRDQLRALAAHLGA